MKEDKIRASASEKIILACNNIQWINAHLTQLISAYELTVVTQTDQKVKDSLMQGIKNHETILEAAAEKIGAVLEDLSDYLNACDAITKLDERVLNGGNEIVILGMDEYERDYEE